MADDVTLNAGAGGDTIAADDIGGVKFQRVKLVEGADGTNDGDVSSANPLPVVISDGSQTANVDLSSRLQVAVGEMPSDSFKAEATSLGSGVLCQADDGTDRHNLQVNASGHLKVDLSEQSDAADLKVTLDSEEVDVTPASPAADDYLPVRITNGTDWGSKDGGWDQASLAVQRGLGLGVTATTDQTLLAADGSNLYNVIDGVVSIFAGTAAPAAKAYVSLYHGPSASGTEFMRVYAPLVANECTHVPFSFRLPNRGAVNQAVVAKLNASLGANGEYSVTVHAYKTSS